MAGHEVCTGELMFKEITGNSNRKPIRPNRLEFRNVPGASMQIRADIPFLPKYEKDVLAKIDQHFQAKGLKSDMVADIRNNLSPIKTYLQVVRNDTIPQHIKEEAWEKSIHSMEYIEKLLALYDQ